MMETDKGRTDEAAAAVVPVAGAADPAAAGALGLAPVTGAAAMAPAGATAAGAVAVACTQVHVIFERAVWGWLDCVHMHEVC
jgi:hypothetical protein